MYGDQVRLRAADAEFWIPATVMTIADGPKSCFVEANAWARL